MSERGEYYNLGEYYISNGGTTAGLEADEQHVVNAIYCRWKGVDQSGTGWQTVSDTIWAYAEGHGGASVGIPKPTGATSAGYYITALNQSGVNGDMYINGSYVGFIQSYGYGYLAVCGAAPGTTASASAYVNGGSGAAYVWIKAWCNYTYQQQVTTTLKTDSPSVTINGYTASHSGPINNGEATAWYPLDVNALPEGVSKTASHTIGGSGKAYWEIGYYYDWAFPECLHEMHVLDGSTTVALPLVATNDPALEYNFLRCQLGSTVYCVDVVSTSDATKSAVRFQKGSTVYAIRKKQT